jgi:hypothetical protein
MFTSSDAVSPKPLKVADNNEEIVELKNMSRAVSPLFEDDQHSTAAEKQKKLAKNPYWVSHKPLIGADVHLPFHQV